MKYLRAEMGDAIGLKHVVTDVVLATFLRPIACGRWRFSVVETIIFTSRYQLETIIVGVFVRFEVLIINM